MEPIKGVIKEERETTISFMNGDTRIELYTSDNGIISKIERLMERYDAPKELIEQDLSYILDQLRKIGALDE